MGAISSMTPVATSTFTPGSVTPQTQSTPQMQLSTPLQQRQSTSASTASTSASMGSTTTTSDIQVLGSTQPDNPKTEQFQFSPPQKIDWNNPPGKDEDEDDEDFPDVSV